MNFNTFKNNLLSYLHDTEEYEKQDIEDHRNLSDDEKEDLGYMIKEAVVVYDDGQGNVELCRHSCISPWQYNHVIQRS